MKGEFNRSWHAAFLVHVPVVFATKYRRKVFSEFHINSAHQYVAEVCARFGTERKECNGEADHLHILIEYPPTVQISELVNSLKAVTSRRLRNEYLVLRDQSTSRLYFGHAATLLVYAEVPR